MSIAVTTTNHPSPGEYIQSEFLDELGISGYRLAKDTGLNYSTINRILHGKSRITPSIALHLEQYFGLGAEYWLNFQSGYELALACRQTTLPHIDPAPGLDFDA